jgi:hypothetical protein
VGALVLPLVIVGMQDASMTRRRSTPLTRHKVSTTLRWSPSGPILKEGESCYYHTSIMSHTTSHMSPASAHGVKYSGANISDGLIKQLLRIGAPCRFAWNDLDRSIGFQRHCSHDAPCHRHTVPRNLQHVTIVNRNSLSSASQTCLSSSVLR